MKPNRIDIIIGKLKSNKSVTKEREPNKMQSGDFVQKIDMSEHDMMYESAGEAMLNAIDQHDAKALAEAICDLIAMKSSVSGEDEEDSY